MSGHRSSTNGCAERTYQPTTTLKFEMEPRATFRAGTRLALALTVVMVVVMASLYWFDYSAFFGAFAFAPLVCAIGILALMWRRADAPLLLGAASVLFGMLIAPLVLTTASALNGSSVFVLSNGVFGLLLIVTTFLAALSLVQVVREMQR